MAKTVTTETPESRVTGQRLLALLELPFQGETLSLVEALDKALEHASKMATRYMGRASLTLTIAMVPKDGKMTTGAKLAVKVPEPGTIPVVFFIDREGLIHDEDPNQKKLPFPTPIAAARKEE